MLGTLCILIPFAALGCATNWVIQQKPSSAEFLWPQPPEKPIIRHVATITGFKETGVSPKSVFFGLGQDELMRPVAVTTDHVGRLAIATPGCVYLYVPSEKRYVKLLTAGESDIRSPVGLVFDDESRLYISDSAAGKVFVFDNQGDYLFAIEKADGDTLKRPTGLAYNSDRKILYVVDTLSNKIYAFDRNGKAVFSFGRRGDGKGEFNYPTHIVWTYSGQIYVTDTLNFRIQIFDASGTYLSAFGHHGDGSGDFSMPKGVAVDKKGTVYVVDTLFDNVQLFNRAGEFLLTVGSRGWGEAEFWLPSGISIGSDGKLYVSDTFNHRIQIFEIIEDGHGLD